jgi:aryl carrier-like protein
MSTLREKLLTMWSDILGKSELQITEDFYDLGGTSLRLIRLLGRIKAELGVDVSYGDLLEGVTIESLSSLLREMGVAESESSVASDSESMQSPAGDRRAEPRTLSVEAD